MKKLLSSRLLWVCLLILVGAGASFKTLRFSSSHTSLGTVVRGDLIQRVTIAGSIIPQRKTLISAPYNGYVRKVYVKVGDFVKAGDPIVSVSQVLHGSGEDVYPQRAPFPGKVVQILRTEGEYVEQSTQGSNTLVRIDDLTHLLVEANSPEVEVDKLKIGQEVTIKASAVLSRSYQGTIKSIALAAKEQKDWDRSRVEFSILISINDPDSALRPGMSVVVDVMTQKIPSVLLVRHEFIGKEGEQYFVINEAGVRRKIDVGSQNEEAFEVKSGVKEGDRVSQVDFLSLLKE